MQCVWAPPLTKVLHLEHGDVWFLPGTVTSFLISDFSFKFMLAGGHYQYNIVWLQRKVWLVDLRSYTVKEARICARGGKRSDVLGKETLFYLFCRMHSVTVALFSGSPHTRTEKCKWQKDGRGLGTGLFWVHVVHKISSIDTRRKSYTIMVILGKQVGSQKACRQGTTKTNVWWMMAWWELMSFDMVHFGWKLTMSSQEDVCQAENCLVNHGTH